MSKEELAKSLFHGAENYNCAQAVMAAFQEEAGISDDEIREYSFAGGGRAEGGICGAAYAAKRILADPQMNAHIDALFSKKAGHTCCKQIRKKQILPCIDCVGLAARFVEDHLPGE